MTDRPESTDIQTDGGTTIGDDVSVTGGDFVAGDKLTYVSRPDLPLYVNVPGLPGHFFGCDALITQLTTRLCVGETTALLMGRRLIARALFTKWAQSAMPWRTRTRVHVAGTHNAGTPDRRLSLRSGREYFMPLASRKHAKPSQAQHSPQCWGARGLPTNITKGSP